MSVPGGVLCRIPSMHVPFLSMCAIQVDNSEVQKFYESRRINTEGQMSHRWILPLERFSRNASRPSCMTITPLPLSSQRRNKKTSELCARGRRISAFCAADTALWFHRV